MTGGKGFPNVFVSTYESCVRMGMCLFVKYIPVTVNLCRFRKKIHISRDALLNLSHIYNCISIYVRRYDCVCRCVQTHRV